jgi:hypothetical protein
MNFRSAGEKDRGKQFDPRSNSKRQRVRRFE